MVAIVKRIAVPAKTSQKHSVIRSAIKLVLAVFLITCATPGPIAADTSKDFSRLLENLLGTIIHQAQVNQQQAQNARYAWAQVDDAVQLCLVRQYQIAPDKLASRGIGPGDPRVQPIIQECQRQFAEGEALAEQERLRQQQQAQEQAEEQASQEQLRQQQLAEAQADELRQQKLAEEQASREWREQHTPSLSMEPQSQTEALPDPVTTERSTTPANPGAQNLNLILIVLFAIGIVGLPILISRSLRQPKPTSAGSASNRSSTKAAEPDRPQFGFIAPLLGCLALFAYFTFLGTSRPFEPLVADGLLLLMLVWSVGTTERFFEVGSPIVKNVGSQQSGAQSDSKDSGATTRGLFLAALVLVALIVGAHSSQQVFDTNSGRLNSGSLQLILTGLFALVLLIMSVQLSSVDQENPDEPTLISRPAMYFVFTFLTFLGFGSSCAFGFLASAVPGNVLKIAIEFRFLLMAAGGALVLVDAGRLFAKKLKSIDERVELAAARRKADSENFIVQLVWGTVDVLLRVGHYILLTFTEFVKSVFSAAVRAVLTAAFFIAAHSIAFLCVIVALQYAPWAFARIGQYLNDGSMAIIPFATVGAFLVVTSVLALVDFVSANFAYPKRETALRLWVVAFTLAGVWLSSALVHLVKTFTGIGPAAFGFPFGPTFYGGLIFFAIVAVWTGAFSETKSKKAAV